MRIFIFGCSGAGKTTLATKLSKSLGLPHHNLDDIQFIKKFSEVRPKEERIKLLHEIAVQPDWIIEGTYTSWPREAIGLADIYVELKMGRPRLLVRVMRRFLRRKYKEKATEESWRGIYELCKYIWEFDDPKKIHRHKYEEMVVCVNGERVLLKSPKEIEAFCDRMVTEKD